MKSNVGLIGALDDKKYILVPAQLDGIHGCGGCAFDANGDCPGIVGEQTRLPEGQKWNIFHASIPSYVDKTAVFYTENKGALACAEHKPSLVWKEATPETRAALVAWRITKETE